MKEASHKEAEEGVLLDGIERIVTKISDHNKENMTKLVSSLKESSTKEESLTPRAPSTASTASTPVVIARGGVTKLTKPIKVPTWSRNMALETFKKQFETWSEINEDIPEFMIFHDLMESLKTNKDIKDLPRSYPSCFRIVKGPNNQEVS